MWSSLFPATCLGCNLLLRHAGPLALCSACRIEVLELSPEPDAAGIAAPFAYGGPLARAVQSLKFGGALALAGPLGRLLAVQPRVDVGWDLLVPVPLHWRRRFARGFDQAEELARALARARGELGRSSPRPCLRMLRRVRATRPQTDLDARERADNVAEAFAVRAREHSSFVGRRVLLVDDVTTTGATLQACRLALLHAGAREVGALALLRTLDPAGRLPASGGRG